MAVRPFVSAIVLAAGESRRMGEANKLLLPFGGRPLVEHVVRAVTASDVDEVIVVLGHEAEAVRSIVDGYPVRVARNDAYAEGMTTSILAGVQAASSEAEGFMICLSDLPLIEPAEFTTIADAFRNAFAVDPDCIVRPVHEGTPGNPVVFSAAYRAAILDHQGLVGCKGLVKQHRDHVVETAMTRDHVVRDVDTPEAYARLTATT